MSKLFLLAALALPLSACGGPDEADTTEALAPVDTALPASDVTVQETVDAIGTDIAAMPLGAATQNIDGWIATLRDAEFDQAGALVDGLETLKTQLAASPIDGNAVARTLADLGSETTAAAVGAEGEMQSGLLALGNALTNAGNGFSDVVGSE